MAATIPTIGHLRRKAEVSDDEIERAAQTYEDDSGTMPFAFKSGHTLDIPKAIEMHPQAKKLLGEKGTPMGLRRTMIRTAIILGFPMQG